MQFYWSELLYMPHRLIIFILIKVVSVLYAILHLFHGLKSKWGSYKLHSVYPPSPPTPHPPKKNPHTMPINSTMSLCKLWKIIRDRHKNGKLISQTVVSANCGGWDNGGNMWPVVQHWIIMVFQISHWFSILCSCNSWQLQIYPEEKV